MEDDRALGLRLVRDLGLEKQLEKWLPEEVLRNLGANLRSILKETSYDEALKQARALLGDAAVQRTLSRRS